MDIVYDKIINSNEDINKNINIDDQQIVKKMLK